MTQGSLQFRGDNGELKHSIVSPSFGVMYPELYGKSSMPWETFKLLDGIWDNQYFPSSAVNVYQLRNVIVAFEGLVFDRELNLYPLTRTGHSNAEIEQAVTASRSLLENSAAEIIKGIVVLCKKRGTYNYGHFLLEMLPKAYWARRLFPNEQLKFIVSDEPAPMSSIMAQAFELLQVPDDAIYRVDREPQFVEELIVVDGLTTHGSFMSPLIMDCINDIAEAIPASSHRRLHVTRTSAHYRKLRNETELAPQFAAHGFLSVDPATLSLRQQISMFKGASQIVGVLGAGLTNICFAPQHCQVTAFVPATMPDTFFWFIANLKRQCFREVRLPEVGGEPAGWPKWSGDVVITPDDLIRWLSMSSSWLSLLDQPGSLDLETLVERAIRQKLQAQFVGLTYETSIFE